MCISTCLLGRTEGGEGNETMHITKGAHKSCIDDGVEVISDIVVSDWEG